MKKYITIILLSVFLGSCSKSDDNPIGEEKTGTAYLKFVKTVTLSGGQTVEEEFAMPFVMIWKAEGKEYVYNGLDDKNYAIDKKTNNAVKAEYEYIDVSTKSVHLMPGNYFIAILTNLDSSPRLAYSYTTFVVQSDKVTEVKKNVSTMESNKYTAW